MRNPFTNYDWLKYIQSFFGNQDIPVQTNQPQTMSIEEIQNKGFKVKIRHLRYFPLIKDENQFYTKYSYLNKYNNGDKTDTFSKVVSTHGGITEVTIKSPDGKEFSAKAVCSQKDQFSRKVGRETALFRAYQKFNQSTEN
jgi:hypothetical protein